MTRLAPQLMRYQEITLLPTVTTAQPNNALTFDGVDGRVVLVSPSVMSKAADFSGSLWFKVTDLGSSRQLIGSSVDTNDRFGITIASSNLRVGLYNGTSFASRSSGFTDTSGWHHLAWNYTSSGHTMVAYVDAVALGGTSNPQTTPNAGGFLGQKTDGGVRFVGAMHDSRVYDRALTVPEITALADADTASATALDTVLHIKGEEIDGTTVYDSSGNSDDGTVAGGVTQSTDALFSFANEVGHTLTAGVIIPRDESATAFDVLGAPLGVGPFSPTFKSGKIVGLDILGSGTLVVTDIEDQTLTYVFSDTGGVESRFPYRLPIRIKSVSPSTTVSWASIIGFH